MLSALGKNIEQTLAVSTPLRMVGGTISAATNTTPIVITTGGPHGITPINGTITAIARPSESTPIRVTCANHGLSPGDRVTISGVVGMTAANGTWTVTNPTTNTFDLVGTYCLTTSGYVSGGTFFKVQTVFVAGMSPLTGANGNWPIDVPSANTITLRGSVGNGAFGGSPIWWAVPRACQFATVQCEKGDINWLADGAIPTPGDGGGVHMIANDVPLQIEAPAFKKFRMINYDAGVGAKVVVDFYGEVPRNFQQGLTAQAFTPNSVTGCVTWLDFADSSTMYKDTGKTTHVATDGDLIACITDKATTPTADWVNSDSGGQPTYNKGGNGINGLSVGTFNQGGTALISPQGLTQTSGEVFIVMETTDDPTSSQDTMLCSVGADNSSLLLGFNEGPLEVDVGLAATSTSYAVDGDTNLSANTPYICNYRSNGSATQAALNGAEQTMAATSGTDNGAWFGAITDGPNLSVGAQFIAEFSAYNIGINGPICEVVIYDHVLSSGDRASVLNYLKGKWAVS